MFKKILPLIAFGVLLTSATYAQKIISDYDTKTDFKKFKTYAWLAPGDSVLNRYRHDKLYSGYITYAANKELTNRGLKNDTENPDAVFMFYTTAEEITRYSQSPTLSIGVGVAGPGYYVAGAAPVAGGHITEHTEIDGFLKYAMYDTQTGKLVWTGMVEKQFGMAEDIEKLIGAYTTKIFKKFPRKP